MPHAHASGFPSPSLALAQSNVAGDRPPRYEKKRCLFTVGRGPVPRQHPRTPARAGDRPPHYEKKRLLGP